MSIGKVVTMIKEEIAPGIMVYSDVIPDSETLYTDIEEGMLSAKIEWQGAAVKEADDVKVNTLTRSTQTIGVPYRGKISEPSSLSAYDVFDSNLHNIFFEPFDLVEKDYMSHYGILQ